MLPKQTTIYSVLAAFLLSILIFLSTNCFGQELELINRPVNISGLTGLLFTTSPNVLSYKTIEISSSALSENSLVPSFSLNEYAISLSAGIGNEMEIALRGAYYTYTIDSQGIRSRNTDDVDIAFKWNFLSQNEDYPARPAIALIAGTTIPSKNRDLITSTVDHWAARIGLSMGSELSWMDHILDLYADAQVAVQDLSQEKTRDRYYYANIGMLLPISKSRNLQMLVEYNAIAGKDVLTITGGDYTAVTYGLRLVNERFNMTIGSQFLHKKEDGFDDSSRVVGLMSFKL